MKTALSIATSDCSGGAGIQADTKAMTLNGVYAMSVLAALTAQNTTGVAGIFSVPPEFLEQQIDMVFADIRPDAVKIGMVPTAELFRVIGRRLRHYGADNIVVDPVMVATSGSKLMERDALSALKEELLPIAALVTPNIPEAEALAGMTIREKDDMLPAAQAMMPMTCSARRIHIHGSRERISIIRTHTAQAVPFPQLSPQILPRALICLHPFGGRRIICRGRWRPCLIWVREKDR